MDLQPLPHRSLQVGLAGEAVDRYVDDWTVAITDVAPIARAIQEMLHAGDRSGAQALLPDERPYPLPAPSPGTSPRRLDDVRCSQPQPRPASYTGTCDAGGLLERAARPAGGG